VRRARLALLALALVAAAYPLAALQTPPGFYEGFCPPVDYKFLTPPPQVKSSRAPASAHAEIKVVSGAVQPGFVATADDNPEAQLSFLPGAFSAPNGGGPEVIDIKPVKDYPDPKALSLVTNVYLITSSTPMVKTSNLRLLYSTLLPAPSSIYTAQAGGEWQALPSNPSTQSGCSDIVAQITTTGYFAAGYPGGSTAPQPGSTTVGGGQALPIIVALAILIVVLAGLPLALVRRRRAAGTAGPPEAPGPPSPPPGRT
jgi:hypothetical protein